jgi:hypothetical protein
MNQRLVAQSGRRMCIKKLSMFQQNKNVNELVEVFHFEIQLRHDNCFNTVGVIH